jgi:Kef-type K+ transport system membrane component KefB
VIPVRRPDRAVVGRPVGSSRTGRDDGMVTAEFAVALPALAIVVTAAVCGVAVMTDQMRCADAAAIAARLAARGEPPAAVRAAALQAAPRGAELTITTTPATVIARVTVRLAPPGLLHRMAAVTTTERVVAARETGTSP